jgi:NADH-quinone oxidoreductase subunit C
MSNEEVLKKFLEKFDASDCVAEEPYGLLSITVDSRIIHDVAAFLRNSMGFNFLTDLCGIHYPGREKALGVIYHLHNMQDNVRIRLKTFVPVDYPHVPTVTDLYAGANWMERETYDFFGIIFDGHPNLKRILNVDYLDYFPMRKEYPLEDPTREDKVDSFFGR